jgi:hypothetical protein
MELCNGQRSSRTHWLSAQSHPQTKASQRVRLPSPEKEIFKNAPRSTENYNANRQYGLLNRLPMCIENKKNEKHDAPINRTLSGRQDPAMSLPQSETGYVELHPPDYEPTSYALNDVFN